MSLRLVASLFPVGHHAFVNFRRKLRLAWVLFTSGTAIYFQYAGTQQAVSLNSLLKQENRNKGIWLHFLLWALIPVLGMVLDLFQSRYAKWLNIGYFVCFGVVFSGIGVLNLPDHHAQLSLLFGILALGVSGVSYLLYREGIATPA